MEFIKVAAYCRVSTDSEDQANSLESQQNYFQQYIERQPFWDLSEIYVDEGITGTSTKKRHSFNRMVADARAGKFSLILTKEISRFARNTLDSIYYTRELKALGVGIIFITDSLDTRDEDAESRLTIFAMMAQEESRRTSGRVKWGQKRRMEQGVVFGRDMLGYDVKSGKLTINEEGAEIVRLIFHKFVNEGKGSHIIARELREAGIRTSTYMKDWSNTVILRVLRNEKYCGDLIQKKTFTPNYLTHEKKRNRGEEELVTLRDHHEPIISREMFDRAQNELARRAPNEEQKAKHSNRYCFSGKIKCAVCGRSFVARSKKRRDNSTYKAWRCYAGARNGAPHLDKIGNVVGCSCPSLNDEDAKQLVKMVVQNLHMDRESIIANLTDIIKTATQEPDGKTDKLEAKLAQLTAKKQRLLEMYLDREIEKEGYKTMSERLEREIAGYQSELAALQKQAELQKNREKLLADMAAVMRGILSGNQWEDTFYSQILENIAVHGNGSVDVNLRLSPYPWAFSRQEHFGASVPTSVSIPVISP